MGHTMAYHTSKSSSAEKKRSQWSILGSKTTACLRNEQIRLARGPWEGGALVGRPVHDQHGRGRRSRSRETDVDSLVAAVPSSPATLALAKGPLLLG